MVHVTDGVLSVLDVGLEQLQFLGFLMLKVFQKKQRLFFATQPQLNPPEGEGVSAKHEGVTAKGERAIVGLFCISKGYNFGVRGKKNTARGGIKYF